MAATYHAGYRFLEAVLLSRFIRLMLHDQTKLCVKRGIIYFDSRSMAYLGSHAMLNFQLSIPNNRRSTISIETNTHSWLFSEIIEQDSTVVTRVVNLSFDFAINHFGRLTSESP